MTRSSSSAWATPATFAAVGLTSYGVYRLAHWWGARERKAIGYVGGNAFEITVVGIDGKPVELATARAFRTMQEAAAREGVRIKVVSGFRTMAEQEHLYDCYVNCSCNNCNLAARPGHSTHQSGHALDLNARDPAVGTWLRAHAGAFGFINTIASEPWHWEYWP